MVAALRREVIFWPRPFLLFDAGRCPNASSNQQGRRQIAAGNSIYSVSKQKQRTDTGQELGAITKRNLTPKTSGSQGHQHDKSREGLHYDNFGGFGVSVQHVQIGRGQIRE